MIETPAAVVMADRLAEVSDFFSVGTNDLTQYTLAVDRGNARLADRFTSHDPAIVRQLARWPRPCDGPALRPASAARWPRSRLSAILLIGLGYRTLSASPQDLPLLKWVVRTVPLAGGREAAGAALEARHPGRGARGGAGRGKPLPRSPAAGPDVAVARAVPGTLIFPTVHPTRRLASA